MEKDIEEKVNKLAKQTSALEKNVQNNNGFPVQVNKLPKNRGTSHNTDDDIVIHTENDVDNATHQQNKDEDTVVISSAPEHSQQSAQVTEIVKNIEVKKGGKLNGQVTIDESVTNKDNEEVDGIQEKVNGFPLDERQKQDNNDPMKIEPVFLKSGPDDTAVASSNKSRQSDRGRLSGIYQQLNQVIVDTPELKKPMMENKPQTMLNNSYAKFATANKIMDHEKLKLKQILSNIDADTKKQQDSEPHIYTLKDNLASTPLAQHKQLTLQNEKTEIGPLNRFRQELKKAAQRVLEAPHSKQTNLAQSVAMPSTHVHNLSLNNSEPQQAFLEVNPTDNTKVCEYL